MKKFTKAFLLMLVLVLVLAACGDKDSDGGKKKDDEKEKVYSIEDFSNVKTNKGEAIEGGSLTFGLVSADPFQGTLNWNFYSGDPDSQILQWFDEALLTWDSSYVYTNDGAATYEVSEDGKTFTFTIKDNVNWHDGEPVTAEDWLFAHEVIGHPDYDGPRYDATLRNVVGMEEYHAGEADTISGIEVVSDKVLKITYVESNPSLITGGIWTYPLAKHIFGDMPVKDISSSPEVREKPIGFGPFIVENIVPGESVVLKKNANYWRGEPSLDEVVVKVVNPNVLVQSLEKGEVDLVSSFPVNQFPENAELSNVEYLGNVDRAYSYIGFKLGTWDKEAKQVKTDPNAKMANKNLRKAMWHAIDNDTVGKRFYHGLRWAGTTLIPPSHPEYHDDTNPGAPYDLDKAKELLDEAGYKDTNDDGFREDPEGNELVINFASMSGDDIAMPLAQYYIQQWEKVGLKVQLLDGRLHDFNSFYERVGEKGDDDPNIDIYAGAWGVGIDVNPDGLYGRDAIYNFTRWSHEENDRLLKEGISDKAFNPEYRKEVYKEWQNFMIEEVPVFPTLYRSVLVPVNNRVHNYAIGDGTGVYLYELAVTQEEPNPAK